MKGIKTQTNNQINQSVCTYLMIRNKIVNVFQSPVRLICPQIINFHNSHHFYRGKDGVSIKISLWYPIYIAKSEKSSELLKTGEGILRHFSLPNPFLLHKVCLNFNTALSNTQKDKFQLSIFPNNHTDNILSASPHIRSRKKKSCHISILPYRWNTHTLK